MQTRVWCCTSCSCKCVVFLYTVFTWSLVLLWHKNLKNTVLHWPIYLWQSLGLMYILYSFCTQRWPPCGQRTIIKPFSEWEQWTLAPVNCLQDFSVGPRKTTALPSLLKGPSVCPQVFMALKKTLRTSLLPNTSSQLWFSVCNQSYFYVSFLLCERLVQEPHELGEGSLWYVLSCMVMNTNSWLFFC